MDTVKIDGLSISPELALLVDEIKQHEERRESESIEDYMVRLFRQAPVRTYDALPPELQKWVDDNLPSEKLREQIEAVSASKSATLSEERLQIIKSRIRYAVRRHDEGLVASYSTADLVIALIAANFAVFQTEEEKTEEDPSERINIKHIENLFYPLDKVNVNIWSLLEANTRVGKKIGVEQRGSRKEIDILYSINFDELGENLRISKRLTQYDKRVYIAVAGLFNAGNDVITLHLIYTAMGGTGKPSDDQRKKISTAVAKMQSAIISIDNSMEAATYNYPKFVYSGYLLPVERIKKIVNGNLVEEAIHIFREPPVMTFARQRRQITTIPVRLLNSPISKTDANLAIEDYLLERISWAKHGHSPCKILYETICKKAGAVTTKQRQRVPEKVERYLTHYVKEGFIASFKAAADGVTISF